MLTKHRTRADNKSKVLGKLKQEQKQLSVTVIEEKGNKIEVQEREHHSIVIMSPRVEKMDGVSRSELEEKKPPDETVFTTKLRTRLRSSPTPKLSTTGRWKRRRSCTTPIFRLHL